MTMMCRAAYRKPSLQSRRTHTNRIICHHYARSIPDDLSSRLEERSTLIHCGVCGCHSSEFISGRERGSMRSAVELSNDLAPSWHSSRSSWCVRLAYLELTMGKPPPLHTDFLCVADEDSHQRGGRETLALCLAVPAAVRVPNVIKQLHQSRVTTTPLQLQ